MSAIFHSRGSLVWAVRPDGTRRLVRVAGYKRVHLVGQRGPYSQLYAECYLHGERDMFGRCPTLLYTPDQLCSLEAFHTEEGEL